MRTLFPDIDPFHTHRLKVTDRHTLYIEECGDPQGPPILFLHGGPGGGFSAIHRTLFDPRWHAVLFDQRGAGQSTPHAELDGNTTWDSVADIERIREMLGIQQWVVLGGSWGSTLALAYAETHPERVKALILRGIFLCRRDELQWFYQGGAHHIFPDYFEPFWNHIPEAERGDMMAAYYKRLTSDDLETRLTAARIWSTYEAATSKLLVDPELISHFDEPEAALALARIECHYFVNNCWFRTDNQLLEDVGRIRHIPGVIVQGRYDVVCPMRSAWDLHRAWPESELIVTPDAGHSAFEAGNIDAQVAAQERFLGL